jgi:hypothetical protein
MLNSLAEITATTTSFLSSYKNQVSRQQGCNDQCIFSGGYESFKSCSNKCVHEEDRDFRYEIINKTSEKRISKIILTKDIIEELVYLDFNCKDSKKAAFIFYTASRNKISNEKFLEIQSRIESSIAC